MSKKLYTRTDVGCYGDSSYGHNHVRAALAKTLRLVEGPDDVIASLEGDMPDDAWDEDEGLEWLNDNVCAHDVFFEFYEGDLMLVCVCPDCGMVEDHAENCPAVV